MSIRLIEIPIRYIDSSRVHRPVPHNETLLEDLTYYYSRIGTVPPLWVTIVNGAFIVTGKSEYFDVACRLGIERLQVVVQGVMPDEGNAILENPEIVILDAEEILAAEAAQPISRQLFVFFFSRTLSEREKVVFTRDVIEFFDDEPWRIDETSSSVSSAEFPFEAKACEFYANVATASEAWYMPFLRRVSNFNAEMCHIRSFQGKKLPL